MEAKKNILKKLFIFLVAIVCIFSFFGLYNTQVVAEATMHLTVNEKTTININAGVTRAFAFAPLDNALYIVETFGDRDTFITVEYQGISSISDDDSGYDKNALVAFKAHKDKFALIKVKFNNQNETGSTVVQVRKQKALLMGFDYGANNINTTTDTNKPDEYLKNIFDTEIITSASTTVADLTINDARGIPKINSEIMFISGHGNISATVLPNGNSINENIITGKMDNVKIAVWSSCYSAYDSNSISQKSVAHGAKSAVGWATTINVGSSRTFTNRLFEKLAEGSTLNDAANYAKNGIVIVWDKVRSYTISGDGSTKLDSTNVKSDLYSHSNNLIEKPNRISYGSWQTIHIDNYNDRIYKTINGYITNDYYDITYDGNKNIIDIYHTGVVIGDENILAINEVANNINQNKTIDGLICSLTNVESQILYVKDGNNLVPYEVNYCTYSAGNKNFEEIVCKNINNNTIIEYDSFVSKLNLQ